MQVRANVSRALLKSKTISRSEKPACVRHQGLEFRAPVLRAYYLNIEQPKQLVSACYVAVSSA